MTDHKNGNNLTQRLADLEAECNKLRLANEEFVRRQEIVNEKFELLNQEMDELESIARVQSAKLAVALDEPGAIDRLDAVMRSSDWKDEPATVAQPSKPHRDRTVTRLTKQVVDLKESRDYWMVEARKAQSSAATVALQPLTDNQIDEFVRRVTGVKGSRSLIGEQVTAFVRIIENHRNSGATPKKGSFEAVFGHLGVTPDEVVNWCNPR